MSNSDNKKKKFSKNAKDLATANLGQKIRFYRQVAGLTQKELADVCGKNESTIRNYELGNRYPDDDTLFEIANALEISPYALSTPKANVAPSALQFLFNLEKTLELTPTMIDGKAYLEVSSEIDVDDGAIPPLANAKRMIAHWASMYEKFQNDEIEEETYLLWQAKYLSFATDAADIIYNSSNEKEISIDENIADAKKRFRKASLKD